MALEVRKRVELPCQAGLQKTLVSLWTRRGDVCPPPATAYGPGMDVSVGAHSSIDDRDEGRFLVRFRFLWIPSCLRKGDSAGETCRSRILAKALRSDRLFFLLNSLYRYCDSSSLVLAPSHVSASGLYVVMNPMGQGRLLTALNHFRTADEEETQGVRSQGAQIRELSGTVSETLLSSSEQAWAFPKLSLGGKSYFGFLPPGNLKPVLLTFFFSQKLI